MIAEPVPALAQASKGPAQQDQRDDHADRLEVDVAQAPGGVDRILDRWRCCTCAKPRPRGGPPIGWNGDIGGEVAYGRLACNGLADALLARHANSCAVHDDGAMQEDADLQIHTLTAMG